MRYLITRGPALTSPLSFTCPWPHQKLLPLPNPTVQSGLTSKYGRMEHWSRLGSGMAYTLAPAPQVCCGLEPCLGTPPLVKVPI